MKSKLLFSLSLLIFLSSCSKDINNENSINQIPLYSYSEWYPDGGDKSDSLLIPIIVDAFINVENIQGLTTNVEEFRLEAVSTLTLPLGSPYVDYEKDTIFNPEDPFSETGFIYDQSTTFYDEFYRGPWDTDNEGKEYYKSDSIYEISDRFSMKIFHDWDLRKYPFDNQKLRFTTTSFLDTTFIRFRENKLSPSVFSSSNNLKKGFKIEEINFKEEFVQNLIGESRFNQGGADSVYSRAVFEIVISRTGSWLFIKLFFGGILALVVSWLVFIIPLRDFPSRIELSIGAVFAAVGNKYFVDSAVESQVLTVADLFNNIIIFMVVLNVGLIIMKRNPVFKSKLINDSRTVSKISIYTALALFCLLTIYTIT